MITDTDGILLPKLVEMRAEQTPDQLAYQEVGGEGLTWKQALDRSLQWADALQRRGIVAEQTVATMLPNDLTSVLSWLGCGWIRAIEAPLNTMYKGNWLVHAFNLTEASLAVVHEQYLAAVIESADELTFLKTVVVVGGDDSEMTASVPFTLVSLSLFLDGADSKPQEGPNIWDISALLFTSGTTGPSKAVMMPWGQFNSQVHIDYGWETDEPLVEYSSYSSYHVAGKVPIYNVARTGSTLILREGFKTDALWDDIRTYGVQQMVMIGPIAQFLMSQPERDDDADNPLKRLGMVPIIPDIERFQKRFNVQVRTGFNATEINTPLMANYDATDANRTSCGRVRPGVEVRIVDEHDLEVPPNTPGELIIRSEPWTLNVGYWNMPEKTNEAWRNGWFHTGDTFIRDEDGYFYFFDRAKDYIRRRGENISSFEVEACVNSHPDVVECAAVAVPSEVSEDEVKLAVVLAPDAQLNPEELIDYLIPKMPRFAIPRYIEQLDELPKTQATLRVQKAKIRDAGVTPNTWDREAAGKKLPK